MAVLIRAPRRGPHSTDSISRFPRSRLRADRSPGTASLCLIETDTAEWAEGDPAADSVLVGDLDSESFAACRTPRAIKVQQRTKHDGRTKDACRDRHVAVRGAEVARHSENRHGRCGNESANSQGSARALRASLEVFPDRQACHVRACYRAHPAVRKAELSLPRSTA